MQFFETLKEHRRIVWAVMLRELATRYGRDNLGFLWIVCEPMVFAVGVLTLYRFIRGPYERGVEIIPFLLTGYGPTILVRHMVMHSLNAVKINGGLLYHKSISVLDLFFARIFLEFIGVSSAFCIILVVLILLGLARPPENPLLVYTAWFTTGFVGCGLALVVGAISEVVEVVERIISVTMYLLVPLSGTFFMADWLPLNARVLALKLPFLNCSEMMRSGFFGDSVNAHYDMFYTITCAAVMTVMGLLIVRLVRSRVDIG